MEPGTIQVMEPVLVRIVPNNKNTTYQVKWDGVRMLAFIREGQVILQNRQGRLKTSAFPELKCLCGLPFSPIVLDGEVVSIRDGRPDFSMILRRNFLSQPGPGAPPISYVVFDLLCYEGKDLRNATLAERQRMLSRIQLPPGPASVIDNFSDGGKLLALTAEKGWEGIVAKDLSSPYAAGKSVSWQKIKNRLAQVFFIIGYVVNQGQLASLLLGKDWGSGLAFAGSVGSGLSSEGRKVLLATLKPLTVPGPPVKVKEKKNWRWVRPLLHAEVEFMEWTESLTLRAPVFKNLLLEGRKYELP